jgi:hypothetical protein
MFTGFSRVGYLVFWLLSKIPFHGFKWVRTMGLTRRAPYLLVCSRRAGLEWRHFMGQVTSMNLGSPSATTWVAALLCRLACLRVRPFRQSRRTRVSSPINTARVSLFAILECTTNRYIHHALRLIIDWVGPAALG